MTTRGPAPVVAAAIVTTPFALWAVLASNHAQQSKYALASIGLLIGLAFIGSGLIARERRPGNATGTLMIAVGFGWYLSALSQANNPYLFTIGSLVGALSFGFLIHLVLAFPSGRLETRFARVLVTASYAIVLGVNGTSVVFSDLRDSCGDRCPRNVALVYHSETTSRALHAVFAAVAAALAVSIVVLLVRRWRNARAAMRRALLPVFVAGAATLAASAVDLAASSAHTGESVAYWVLLGIFFGVPLAFLFGLLRSRFTGSAMTRVLASRDTAGPREHQALLREALGDPDLQLGYWYAPRSAFVDADGALVDPSPGEGRHATELHSESGEPLALVLHDVALLDEPARLNGVLAAARVTLQRDRLETELRARMAELKESRSRIVAAAAAERRRLEHNLHDGAQQRLVAISLTLRLAQSKLASDPEETAVMLGDAVSELTLAMEELRELARGLHPAVLTERGLAAALRALAERSPVPVELDVNVERRLPEAVEVALFYVVSESLTNVAKYAEASRAAVHIASRDGVVVAEIRDDGIGGAAVGAGTGLLGLVDRVEALDGTLTVVSPESGGTTVTAVVPAAA